MLKKKLFIFFVLMLCCLLPVFLHAQIKDTALEKSEPTFLFISAIKITGNKRTKSYIIEREMQYKVGDKIYVADLKKSIKQAQTQIYNINLFIG